MGPSIRPVPANHSRAIISEPGGVSNAKGKRCDACAAIAATFALRQGRMSNVATIFSSGLAAIRPDVAWAMCPGYVTWKIRALPEISRCASATHWCTATWSA